MLHLNAIKECNKKLHRKKMEKKLSKNQTEREINNFPSQTQTHTTFSGFKK